jgi:hypothetical protein
MSAPAAGGNLGKKLQKVGEDAAQGYLGPFVTVFGSGMNSGWHNSAKPLSLFNKLPIGVSVLSVNIPAVRITDDMRTFDFAGDLPVASILPGVDINAVNSLIVNAHSRYPTVASRVENELGYGLDGLGLDSVVHFEAEDQPTVFGPKEADEVAVDTLLGADSKAMKTARAFNAIQKELGNTEATDTIPIGTMVKLPFKGIIDAPDFVPTVPSATIQVGLSRIPVIDNITAGLRFVPPVPFGDFGRFGQIGAKLQYEFLHKVPVIGKIRPLNASVSWAINTMSLEAGDAATLKQLNWIGMISASVDKNIGPLGLGVFVGVGVENSRLTLDVTMPENSLLDDFSAELKGDNTFRLQLGPRISVAVFDIWGNINVGSVTSYNAGVTVLGLNGHGL